jgi:hypothetical protein
LCRCYDNNAFVSYCVKGVSFVDKISDEGFEILSLKRLPIQVFFQGLGVISSVRFTNVHFPDAKD